MLNDNYDPEMDSLYPEYDEITKKLISILLGPKIQYVYPGYLQFIYFQIRSDMHLVYHYSPKSEENKADQVGRWVATTLAEFALLCDVKIQSKAKELSEVFPPLKKHLIDTIIFVPEDAVAAQLITTYWPPEKSDTGY